MQRVFQIDNEIEIVILLATFNSERYLEEQLDSIINQTYTKWKILVQDGGSTDSTLSILLSYKEKLQGKLLIYRSEKKLSTKENFSLLLSKSYGDLFMFCDHDDVWLPDKIQVSVSSYFSTLVKSTRRNEPILIFTDSIVVDSKLNQISSSFLAYENLDASRTTFKNLLLQNVGAGNTMLFNKALKEKIFPIPTQAIMHDYWAMLVASAFGKIVYVNKKTLLYRQHGHNVIGAKKYKIKQLMNMKKIFKEARRRLNAQLIQASCFYANYGEELSKEDRGLLMSLVSLKEKNFLLRKIELLRNSWSKSGLLRSILFFLIF